MLAEGLKESAKEANVPIVVNRVGSLLSCFFTNRPVRNFEGVKSTNIRQFKTFFAEMLNRGIYIAPSAYEAMFVSLAHSRQDIEKTIRAGREIFGAIR
jgi:glutamate-1-semialdehyde 2,1-aminomutase